MGHPYITSYKCTDCDLEMGHDFSLHKLASDEGYDHKCDECFLEETQREADAKRERNEYEREKNGDRKRDMKKDGAI